MPHPYTPELNVSQHAYVILEQSPPVVCDTLFTTAESGDNDIDDDNDDEEEDENNGWQTLNDEFYNERPRMKSSEFEETIICLKIL